VDVKYIKCVLKMGYKDVDWIHLVHDRFQWRDVVKAVIKLWVHKRAGIFRTQEYIIL
jgi:hypothetical protein